MIEIEGHVIPTTLSEKVDPSRAAVVVIDMQRDFTTKGCFWDRIGQDVTPMAELAERLTAFLDAARAHRVPIVHVMAIYDAEYMNGPMHERLHRHGVDRYCQSGTFGAELHPGLEPQEGEPLVVKHRFDAFYDTELDMLLRNRGVDSLILTGVATHGCVDSTARHGYFNGYYVVFAEDLTGGADPTTQQVTHRSIDLMFGITAPAEEIVAAWSPGTGDRSELVAQAGTP